MPWPQIVNVELPNIMLFAGRGYHRYVSPTNATLLRYGSGDLHGDTLLRQVVGPPDHV